MKTQKIPIDRIDMYKAAASVGEMIKIAYQQMAKKMPLKKKKAIGKLSNTICDLINQSPYKRGMDFITNTICIQMGIAQIGLIISQPDKPSPFAKGGIIVKPNLQEKGPEFVAPLNIPGNGKVEIRIDGKAIGAKTLATKQKKE